MSTTESDVPVVEVPVLVVGAGPAGLVASLALSRYGVRHLVVERHSATAHTPRAHIVNQRTVEILRHLGIEDRFHAVATPQHLMGNNLWVTTLAGREIVRTETWGTSPDRREEYASSSPAPMANCPQTVFEPLLLEAAREAGADVRFHHAFESAVTDVDRTTSTILDRRDGSRFVVRSRYVLGADGARSAVLDAAGLTIEGPAGLAHAANVWFRADLTRHLEHRPGVLIWNAHPGPLLPLRLGTLICHKPFTEFVHVFMYDPATENLHDLDEAELVRRVRAVVGDEGLEVEVLGIAGWQVNAQVAPRWSNGPIFCLGDAVHRHPPTNGLGLNMSVADAYNVAWKLALVLDGRAGEGLLDTYDAERRPVGAAGVERAITSLQEMALVDQALGYEPGQSEEEGWDRLARLDDLGPEGDAARTALREAVARTDLQFNAHGLELGYRYEGPAVVGDGTREPVPDRDPVLHYVSTSRPGARVPHARLERAGQALSSLDLLDGLDFGLLTGIAGQAWRAAADAITLRFGVPVRVHVIGTPGLLDPYGEWAARSEVGPSGAVLVRPDRHVAWRIAAIPEDPEAALAAVLAQVLDRDLPALADTLVTEAGAAVS